MLHHFYNTALTQQPRGVYCRFDEVPLFNLAPFELRAIVVREVLSFVVSISCPLMKPDSVDIAQNSMRS